MAHYPGALICLSLCFICCAVASLADRYKDYEIVIPRKVNELGEFVSHSLSHYHKRDGDGPSDNLHYSVPISGRDHHLELLPNRKISSPGALVETISRAGTKQFKRMSDNNRCHFGGTVRGVRGSRAAVSTCNGLAGYIRTDDGHYLIEPAAPISSASGPHPHVVYKDSGDAKGNCGSDVRRRNARDGVNATAGIASVDVPIEMHIESLVVLDQAILRYRKEIDIENFVLTVFNMASAYTLLLYIHAFLSCDNYF
ncbi:PREDICTED: A disintegrin and metalloproteinase with thrombospondin motifs 18-like [Nicrophorus vespilloides]|uniref:A disintegrin and metalloproteinase with thrombospondin motifs 18-like n=1 Tax=Nicrophorus vespilloides TaxID=110193 RepID=A0ABM1MYE0_NICVS|nr:PREDICTED: A disintegrin and metalloproteinase with thrombospondin motifs 18-like [Nicrophorus vespilloides]